MTKGKVRQYDRAIRFKPPARAARVRNAKHDRPRQDQHLRRGSANDWLHPRADGARDARGPGVISCRLGENVADPFARKASMRVIRSRDALSADGEPMCLNLEQAAGGGFSRPDPGDVLQGQGAGEEAAVLALRGVPLSGTLEPPPDVFIAAHQMMFHEHKKFGRLPPSASTSRSGRLALGHRQEFWTTDRGSPGRRRLRLPQQGSGTRSFGIHA